MTVIAKFEISFSRFLDSEGRPVAALPAFAARPRDLIPLYRAMLLTRSFDAKAIALQRTGRLGTYASALGQEAVGVGLASAMRPDDVLVPAFREQGAQLWRGVTMVELFSFWGGDERGGNYAGPRQDFPVCVPVGTNAPHAAGIALAMKLRGEGRAVVCALGDGATSKGDVYEAMNLAGVWRLPVVFVINNNQWAISVPRSAQTAAETLAQKAIAAGFPGIQVDGNDVVAVRHEVEAGMARARSGAGPTLVEAVTFRLGDHTTADDASRYRDDSQVSQRWREEPILRLRRYLTEAAGWTKQEEEALIGECGAAVDAAADAYLGLPPQPPESIFDHLYATLPPSLADQRAALLQQAGENG